MKCRLILAALVNITGVLNARDDAVVLAIEADAANAHTTIALWDEAEKKHPGKQITHICVDARYYRSVLPERWLKEHPNSKVKCFPAYLPNLNLIERSGS